MPSTGWMTPKRACWSTARSGRGAVQVPATSLMLDDGTIEPRLRLIRPTEASTVPARIMDDTHWLEADRAAFDAAWTAELAEVPEVSEVYTAHRRGASVADLEAASPGRNPCLPAADR